MQTVVEPAEEYQPAAHIAHLEIPDAEYLPAGHFKNGVGCGDGAGVGLGTGCEVGWGVGSLLGEFVEHQALEQVPGFATHFVAPQQDDVPLAQVRQVPVIKSDGYVFPAAQTPVAELHATESDPVDLYVLVGHSVRIVVAKGLST